MPGSLDEHDLPKCKVILAVGPTMQSNDGTERIPRCGCPNHHWSTFVLHCGSTHKLAMNLGKEKNWTRQRISLVSVSLQTSPSLMANSFGRNWTIGMLIQLSSYLAAVVWCFLPTMRFNERLSLSVSLEVRPELLWLLEVFPCFLNSAMVLDMVAL